MVSLYDHQRSAIEKMKNGCILCGGVGSGKSRTALAYYYLQQGGNLDIPDAPMKNPLDIYIITTARKRDTCEWEDELAPFLLSTHEDCNYYKNKVVIDSWNNISKYKDVKNSFFIFDEQRVVGYGAWTKAFLKIAKVNKWILLSATPGDTWQDYIPVFIANGFYRNKTDFIDQHVVYDWRSKYPKVDRYLNTGRLIRLRNRILVTMEFERHTTSHHQDVPVSYNIPLYKDISRNRWNPWEDRPIETASELCMNWRRVVNSDESRSVAVLEIMEDHPKVGTVANSCSTMHKIAAKEFTLDDFSYEHLDTFRGLTMYAPLEYHFSSLDLLNLQVDVLNQWRTRYLNALKTETETGLPSKDIWWQMIQLLPSSYNQKRTVMLNYEVLANMYKSRRNHKLDEWHTLCDWIESLPYSKLITGGVVDE